MMENVINNSANVNLGNITQAGQNNIYSVVLGKKTNIKKWTSPNYSSGVNIPVATTEKTYTCTNDGRIDYFLGYDTGTDGTYIKVNNVTMMSTTVSSGYPKLLCGSLDVFKNDVVKYKVNTTGTTSKMTFYPYKE